MKSLIDFVQFGVKHHYSHSLLIDFYHIHVRNIILFCTSLCVVRQLFGEVIHCQNTVYSVSQFFVDTVCYINGTLTKKNKEIFYHNYYQWVPVYLLLLSFGFAYPYTIWRKTCGQYSQYLQKIEKPKEVIQVIRDSKGDCLFFNIWLLECIYFGYLMLILCVTDAFFNRYWSYFGWSWTAIDILFPDCGSCDIDYYQDGGNSSGKLKCLLPMCSIYRKVFWALYGLMVLLIAWNVYILIYRIILILWKRKNVNMWWSLKMMEHSMISWYDKKVIQLELEKLNCKENTKHIPKDKLEKSDWVWV